MSSVLRVRLSGGDARLGAVPATDVAKLLIGVERAVARGVAEVLGRRVKPTGRWGAVIESAVHFRLVGIESGSVVAVLELPEVPPDPGTLDMDVGTLGEMGVASALKTLRGDAANPDVAAAFVRLIDHIGVGSRYDAVTFDADLADVGGSVVLDEGAGTRLRRVAAQIASEVRQDTLVGVLVEADFENMTARLRSSDGQRIAVTFEETLADDIQEALRRPAEVVGQIEYDPDRARAVTVELRAITRAEQLAMELEPGEFWDDVTIDDLRARAGVEPITTDVELSDPELTDGEAEAFLAALTS